MGSYGKANTMLISQHQFPWDYDYHKDKIASAYLDRMREWDSAHITKCLQKYRFDMTYLDSQIRVEESEQLFKFICELMKEDRKKWSGYRVTGNVGGDGHAYYHFQLFYKHPESTTMVYSGDKAPNIEE